MKTINAKKIFLGLLVSFSFIAPVFSFAQNPPTLLDKNTKSNTFGTGKFDITKIPKSTQSNTNTSNTGGNTTSNEGTVNVKDSDVKSGGDSLFKQIMQEEGKYIFMAPFGPFESYANSAMNLKAPEALAGYLKTWFKFLVGVGGVIGVVRLIMAGFDIITKSDSIDAVKRAKSEITSIVSSLVLVALSWVILNSINPELVTKSLIIPSTTSKASAPKGYYDDLVTGGNLHIGVTKPGWYFKVKNTANGKEQNVYAASNSETECIRIARAFKKPGYEVDTSKCYDYTNLSLNQLELEKRDMLKKGGVTIKTLNVCANPYTDCNCTYVGGLHDSMLQKIINAGKDSGASLMLTAGAEKCAMIKDGKKIFHAEHSPNNAFALDLRRNQTLINFLEEKADVVIPLKNSTTHKRYLYDGLWFADEPLRSGKNSGVHFHISAPRGTQENNNNYSYNLGPKYMNAHCKKRTVQNRLGFQFVCN